MIRFILPLELSHMNENIHDHRKSICFMWHHYQSSETTESNSNWYFSSISVLLPRSKFQLIPIEPHSIGWNQLNTQLKAVKILDSMMENGMAFNWVYAISWNQLAASLHQMSMHSTGILGIDCLYVHCTQQIFYRLHKWMKYSMLWTGQQYWNWSNYRMCNYFFSAYSTDHYFFMCILPLWWCYPKSYFILYLILFYGICRLCSLQSKNKINSNSYWLQLLWP